MFSIDKKYLSISLSCTLFTNKSILLESFALSILSKSIRFAKKRSAKQSRKSSNFAKFVYIKKIFKKSKQARVSAINNIDLDILQQALSNYFKSQILSIENSTKQQLLLRKIENILDKNLKKIKRKY